MIDSTCPEIRNLRMSRITAKRPFLASRVIMIDGMVIMLLVKGGWWASWYGGHNSFNRKMHRYTRAYGTINKLLTGLALLGVIDEKTVEANLAEMKKAREAETMEYDQSTLNRISKEYGVSVPKLTFREPAKQSKRKK